MSWQHYTAAFVRVAESFDLTLIDLPSGFGEVIMNNYYYYYVYFTIKIII